MIVSCWWSVIECFIADFCTRIYVSHQKGILSNYKNCLIDICDIVDASTHTIILHLVELFDIKGDLLYFLQSQEPLMYNCSYLSVGMRTFYHGFQLNKQRNIHTHAHTLVYSLLQRIVLIILRSNGCLISSLLTIAIYNLLQTLTAWCPIKKLFYYSICEDSFIRITFCPHAEWRDFF